MWEEISHLKNEETSLGDGFNPVETYYLNWIISPGKGSKKKWKHHQETYLPRGSCSQRVETREQLLISKTPTKGKGESGLSLSLFQG